MADRSGDPPLTRRELLAREAEQAALVGDDVEGSPNASASPAADETAADETAVLDAVAEDEADAPAVGQPGRFDEDVLEGEREWTFHELADEDLEDQGLGATTHRHRRPRDVIGTILGGVGELLVTAGVLLGLFVVWQVWWTDIKAGQHAASVIAEMGLPDASDNAIADGDKQTGPAPLPQMPEGAYAVLRVPAWGTSYMVPIEDGVGLDSVLHQGLAGHYPDTQGPGQIGNFALAGHRQSHGAIFRNVDQLQPGDALIVETADTWYVYTVTGSDIVAPTQVDVIAPVPGDPGAEPTTATITLTTCHPLWSTAERFVVHGELAYWAPRDAGTPAELEVA